MPRKTKNYKKPRKAKLYRRHTLNALTPRGQAIAPSAVVNLRFSDFVTIDPGAATALSYIYRANSVYDPRFGAGGSGPLGYNEWSAFYDHFVVLKSTCTVRFVPSQSTALTGSALVGISVEDDSASSTIVPLQLIERQGAAWGIMTGAAAEGVKILRKSFDSKKFFGVSDVDDNISKLGAAVVTNPAEGAFYHVSAAAVDASSNPSALTAIVQIDYTVKFTERKALPQS